VIFGWPDQWTTVIMGVVVVAYTAYGGIKAVTWTGFPTDVGYVRRPRRPRYSWRSICCHRNVTFVDALHLAGAAGRLNAVVTSFDWNDRYNLWNGLLGGMFLALAYFGCDQSQVQRYLTGSSVTQSRLSLLFNAIAKIPMQFTILLVGAIVFVFFIFEKPPIIFHQQERVKLEQRADYPRLSQQYDAAFEDRRTAAREFIESGNPLPFKQAHARMEQVRKQAAGEVNDTNYIFLGFVTRYLPAGMVGLIMAAIFAAAMSTISAEINSLATVSVIDIYKRFLAPAAGDGHTLNASRLATVFWGYLCGGDCGLRP
jgi:Na+/proline symporter